MNLANQLSIKGLTAPELSRCRQFYTVYPQILGVLTQESLKLKLAGIVTDFNSSSLFGLPTQELKFKANIKEYSNLSYLINILQSISYTHFTELLKIEDYSTPQS